MSASSWIMIISCLLFYLPFYIDFSYQKRPAATIGFYLLFGALLSFIMKTHYVFIFQALIVIAQLLHFNTHKFKNSTFKLIAFHLEKPVLLSVFILILYVDLPLKTLLILALLGVRFLRYLKAYFPNNRMLNQYIKYTITAVYLLALMFRHTF